MGRPLRDRRGRRDHLARGVPPRDPRQVAQAPGAEIPIEAEPVDAPDMAADLPRRWKHLLGVLGAILFPPLVVLLFVLAPAPLVAVNLGFLAYHGSAQALRDSHAFPGFAR